MPARSTHHLLPLVMILAASSLGANSSLLPQPNGCDPSKASCVPAPEKKACEATNCFSTIAAQREHEERNNCTFICSDTITAISAAVLRQIFTSASITEERLAAIAAELSAALKNTLMKGLIDTKRKLAHFLAQVKEEVGPGLRLTEDLDYSVDRLKSEKGPFSYFIKNPEEAEKYGRKVEWTEKVKTDKKGNPLIGKDGKPVMVKIKTIRPADKEAIANRAYANLNGNGSVASGDGWKYRGRGLIQLTGKSNYKSFSTEHNKIWTEDIRDFEASPDLVAEGKYAVRSALVFWKNHGLEKIAEKGVSCTEVNQITAKINKYTDSYAARCNNFKTIMRLDFFKECDPIKDIRRP